VGNREGKELEVGFCQGCHTGHFFLISKQVWETGKGKSRKLVFARVATLDDAFFGLVSKCGKQGRESTKKVRLLSKLV
jgi:hypothetical protein